MKVNSKQSSTKDLASTVQTHIPREKKKKNLLADRSDDHVVYRVTSQIWQMLQYGMGSYARPMEKQELIKLCDALQRIFGHNFSTPAYSLQKQSCYFSCV